MGLTALNIAPNHESPPRGAFLRAGAGAPGQHAAFSADEQHVSDTELSTMNLNTLLPLEHALHDLIEFGVTVAHVVFMDFNWAFVYFPEK